EYYCGECHTIDGQYIF
nr:immunoglobulin light chain junction region [Macaca mulatta]MOX78248.1 immunoglobulin light chain junction region [Macaca mulatta]MOX78427.1 immunoglobulin light chain junction region [Macaca mulatta]MOX78680.1 immunoglobulin light chain junction region [Macaca mulatta]MOX78702.1 immunoglobulin light chain junction region [Macaca mulatta]